MESTQIGPDIVCSELIFSLDDPVLSDHFPSRPIVPAYTQLAKVVTCVANSLAVMPHRIRVRTVKFLRPIEPGCKLTLRIEPRVNGSATFTISFGDETVSRGEVAIS